MEITVRKSLANVLLFPRRAARSPDELVTIEIRAIGQDGQQKTAQIALPAEEVAALGEELLNG